MEPIRRVKMADQAEVALRDAIRAGHFSDSLPGIRLLAGSLAVNPVAVAEAVSRLVADGTLSSEGPRKRFRIARSGRMGRSAMRRKILYLTSESLHEAKSTAVEILSHLLLERPEWDFQHRAAGYGGEIRPNRRRWDGLLKSDAPDHVVAFGGRPELAKWTLDRGVPAYFLGGDSGELPVPMLGVNGALMIRQLMERMMELGHTRICLPICGMPEGFVDRQRRSMAEFLAGHGLPFVPNYHAPLIARDDRDEFAQVLRGVFKVRPPTALVLVEPEHFFTVSGVVQEFGLQIPRDVSMGMLISHRMFEWNVPRIAHFQFPVVQVAKTLARWIETPPEDLHIHVSLPLELVEAESLLPAPDGSRRGGKSRQ